jgi:hypothetical protein
MLMRIPAISKTMTNARNNPSNDSFQQVGNTLNNNKNTIREGIQDVTSSEINNIILKLQDEKQLVAEELELIKLWIIGDAESYIKRENNFQDWMEEFKRLETVLIQFENKYCSIDDLFELHGVLEDAIRISYDIANYLEKKERMEKFLPRLSDTRALSDEDKDILIRVLKGKLKSPDF